MKITIESLKEMLKEKEALKKQTETIYIQVMGQIQLLNSMIQNEETPEKEK